MKWGLSICFLLLILISQANAFPGCCLNPESRACQVMDSADCCKDAKCLNTQFFQSDEEYACAIMPEDKAKLCTQGCCCKHLGKNYFEANQAKQLECAGEGLLWTSDFSVCDKEFCASRFGLPPSGIETPALPKSPATSTTYPVEPAETPEPAINQPKSGGSKCASFGGKCERGLFRGGILAFIGLVPWCDKDETRIKEGNDCGGLKACCWKESLQVCTDGTISGSCSKDKPYVCEGNQLKSDCQKCGCPAGKKCNSDGSCGENPCKTLLQSGSPDLKLDIVFLGEDYLDQKSYEKDVSVFMNGLLALEPFRSQRNKINIYRADNTQDLECYYNCGGLPRLLCCSGTKIEEAIAQCPHEQVIVIVNNEEYGGSGGGYSISYRGNYRVAIHEFGHAFGALMDEYSYGGSGGDEQSRGPNCDSDSSCSMWSDLMGERGVGCFQSCSHDDWYRPISENSIMLDLGGDFNPVCERALTQKLGVFS